MADLTAQAGDEPELTISSLSGLDYGNSPWRMPHGLAADRQRWAAAEMARIREGAAPRYREGRDVLVTCQRMQWAAHLAMRADLDSTEISNSVQ